MEVLNADLQTINKIPIHIYAVTQLYNDTFAAITNQKSLIIFTLANIHSTIPFRHSIPYHLSQFNGEYAIYQACCIL